HSVKTCRCDVVSLRYDALQVADDHRSRAACCKVELPVVNRVSVVVGTHTNHLDFQILELIARRRIAGWQQNAGIPYAQRVVVVGDGKGEFPSEVSRREDQPYYLLTIVTRTPLNN